MPRHLEPLSGGLVTNRDPALLSVGELAMIQNATYRPGRSGLQRAVGRSAFASASANAVDVNGLRDMQFDNGDHYLVAHASSIYFTATVGDTGAFGTLASALGVGSQLERVHFRNRFYLLNGVASGDGASALGSNRAAYLSATAAGSQLQIRQHGMLPVDSAPTVTTAGGGLFSQTVTGYYEYWTTEVAKLTQDGAEFVMESSFSGATTTVFVSATTVVPTIQMPPTKNSIATHWRVYRSTKKDTASDKRFPTGYLVSEAAIATGTNTNAQADTPTTSNTGNKFPTTYNSSPPFNDATNPSNMGADDAAVATLAVGAAGGIKAQGAYGFNFGGFVGAPKGITVTVQAHISSGSAPCPVTVYIGRRASSGAFLNTLTALIAQTYGSGITPATVAAKSQNVTSTSAGSPDTLVFGTTTDAWFPSDSPFRLNDSDFNTNFMVVVAISKPSTTLSIDYITVNSYYGGTTDSVQVFPTVVYTFGDVTSQVGKNFPPPSSNTGDLYEDCLVVNDVSNAALIRWSAPGSPDAFPPTYFLDIETPDNDEVKLIKVVNDVLVVGTRTGYCRVNYLPSERDASFDRGKAYKWVSRTFGVVNPMCAAVYSPPGGGERLACVSDQMIYSTDGFDFVPLTQLDWRRVIPLGTTATPIALINDPELQELVFFYRNDSNGNETYLALHLSYSPDHPTRTGKLKVSGPVNMRNYHAASSGRADLKSAWPVRRSTGKTDVYLGYGGAASAAGAGYVYRETGSTIPAEDPAMKFRTRRMYLSGMSDEWRLDSLYGYISQQTGTQTVRYTSTNYKTNAASAMNGSAPEISLASGTRLHSVNFQQQAEGLQIEFSVVSGHDDLTHELLILEGPSFGGEDSGL